MSKNQLIKKYEDMMFEYGEYDVWEDDVLPKLKNMKFSEIKEWYDEDKKFYADREAAGGHW